MKNRIIVLISILAMLGSPVMAQVTDGGGVSFGIRAGINFQNINGKDNDDDNLELKMVPRFNAGVVADIPVAPEFYFQPGLLYTTKGAKTEETLNSSLEYNISYLELPLSFLYKPVLGSGYMLLGFGPYVAYGLGGKVKIESPLGDEDMDIEWTDETNSVIDILDIPYSNAFKRLDFGANLFFGYQLQNGFSVQLNTQLGLAKINADNNLDANDEMTFRNTGFGISLGYMF